jgi:superfamily II DNA or RNA helicase
VSHIPSIFDGCSGVTEEDLTHYLGVEKPWPWQIRALEMAIDLANDYGSRTVITAPTGAGKSIIFLGLCRWAIENNKRVAIYCCRNLLIQQLIAGMKKGKLDFGVRAAQFRKLKKANALVQLCSLDTVYASFKRELHDLPRADIVVVDEAHQQRQTKACQVFERHAERGASLIGFTATPVDLSHIYDNLEAVCVNSEMRSKELEYPAHVPALTFGCPEMDTSKLKPLKTGEFSNQQVIKEVWTPQIFGHIVEHYKKLNPKQKPALLFAPGVKESKWLCDMLNRHDIPAAHIDGSDVYIDGEEHSSDPEKREEVIERLKSGEIKVICNRFVMREGIDIPELFHIILATPIGSLASYVQVVGRVLRNHPSIEKVVVQDHAGNFWRHGSPNQDRDWSDYFYMTSNQASEVRKKEIEKGEVENPIICPRCMMVRQSGFKCPGCGYTHSDSRRMVIQRNGQLVSLDGPPISKVEVKRKSDSETQWIRCYYRCSKSNRTFNQAYALFVHEQGYHPPRDLRFMPINEIDWYERCGRVVEERLR